MEKTKDAIDFSLYTKYYSYERLKIHAAADYQLNNAAIAIASVHALGDRYVISPAAVMAGVEAFRWPGRMEYIYPWLLVDGGHNLEGVEAFVQHLNGYETHGTTDLLFVCMNDKELKKMCQAILGIRNLGDIYIPTMPHLRAIDYRMAADTFSDLGFDRVTAIHHLEDFLDNRKREVGARTLLGAIGSLYLVGEIKKYRGGHIVD